MYILYFFYYYLQTTQNNMIYILWNITQLGVGNSLPFDFWRYYEDLKVRLDFWNCQRIGESSGPKGCRAASLAISNRKRMKMMRSSSNDVTSWWSEGYVCEPFSFWCTACPRIVAWSLRGIFMYFWTLVEREEGRGRAKEEGEENMA